MNIWCDKSVVVLGCSTLKVNCIIEERNDRWDFVVDKTLPRRYNTIKPNTCHQIILNKQLKINTCISSNQTGTDYVTTRNTISVFKEVSQTFGQTKQDNLESGWQPFLYYNASGHVWCQPCLFSLSQIVYKLHQGVRALMTFVVISWCQGEGVLGCFSFYSRINDSHSHCWIIKDINGLSNFNISIARLLEFQRLTCN